MSTTNSPPSPSIKPPKEVCPLGEIIQYECELGNKKGTKILCSPISRIYRLCAGRPAVEVTHHVKFDEQGRAYEDE
ncbi:unnamed protein product [Sympodiomycopsis kandeliae]